MANPNHVSTFQSLYNQFKSIDREKIYRESLGELSRKSLLEPVVEGLEKRSEVLAQVVDQISDSSLNNYNNYLQQCVSHLTNLAQYDAQNYVSNVNNIIAAIQRSYEATESILNPATSLLLLKSGLFEGAKLESTGSEILAQYESTVSKKIHDFEENADKKIQELLNAASLKVEEKSNRALQTSRGISLEQAQFQFRNLSRRSLWGLSIWGGVSTLGLASFFIVAIYFHIHFPIEGSQIQTTNPTAGPNVSYPGLIPVIYSIAMRVTILSAIGAVVAYSMNILRSHIHMYYKNEHRIALANSTESFIASCRDNQTGDSVFMYLVQAMSEFGESGLLESKQENIHPTKLIVDIAKDFGGRSTKNGD